MDCVCTVSTTGSDIAAVTVFHASGTVLPGKWSKVLTVQDVGNDNSQTAKVPQEAGTNDWWSVVVTPSNGGQAFILQSPDIAPWAEAEVPKDGSISLVLGSLESVGSENQIPITFKTWKDRNFSDWDGNVHKTLVANYITPNSAASNDLAQIIFDCITGT